MVMEIPQQLVLKKITILIFKSQVRVKFLRKFTLIAKKKPCRGFEA